MRERSQIFDPRQVMRREDFEIFHYRNPRQGSVEVHHHDFFEIYFFLGGRVEYRVEGQVYRLQPGDLLLINPMELHQCSVEDSTQTYERIVLWINRAYLESFCRDGASLIRCFDSALPTHSNLIRPTHTQRTQLQLLLETMVRERYGNAYAGDVYAAGILLQFLAEVNRIAMQNEGQHRRERADSLIDQVLVYISGHYDEDLTLEKMAGEFFVSKYYLAHEFSRQVGTGLHKYVQLKRLQMARQMLADGETPGSVCARCGFGDYANFYRVFRAQYGVSPSQCAPMKR